MTLPVVRITHPKFHKELKSSSEPALGILQRVTAVIPWSVKGGKTEWVSSCGQNINQIHTQMAREYALIKLAQGITSGRCI